MAGKRAVQYLVERGGRFWARVVVPADVRDVIGAKELREPLGGDRAKANWTCGIVAGKFLKRIADARASKGLPLQASAAALAQRYYAELLAIDQTMRADHRNVSVGIDDRRVDGLRDVSAGRLSDASMAEIVAPMVNVFRENGVSAEPGTPAWRELARLVASVELEALRRVAERDEGEPETPPTLPILVDKPPEAKAKVPLLYLLDAYLKERAHLGKGAEARKRWTPVFKQFVAHLGHDDAEAVTSEKAEEWLSAVLKLKAAKTVRDTDLGSLKAVYRWAKRKKRVSHNPFEEVRLDAPRKVRTREAGFTDTEALAVLKAANAHPTKAGLRESKTLTAAKRWAPWLCAFSGARIAEMTASKGGRAGAEWHSFRADHARSRFREDGRISRRAVASAAN